MPAQAKKQNVPANVSASDGLKIVRAEGNLVFDARERGYIDFIAGWCVGNLGWSQPEIEAAIRNFDGPPYVYPNHVYAPWAQLAKLLAELAPGKLTRTFRATGGSEAVDIALQAAMLHTGRRKIVSIDGSYHGNSFAGRSIGGAETRESFPNLLRGCLTVKPPLDGKKLDRVKTLLRGRDVAAFIMEPVICNLGVLIPGRDFMRGVQQLCRRYGTLLIMDEVATGFGRTGKMFGYEHFQLSPDILCLAKAITGGYAPMGAVLTTAAVAKSMQEVGAYSTYGWHPLSVAAALANVHYWKRHKGPLLRNVIAAGSFIEARLALMKFKQKPTVRAKGLAIGVDVGDEDYAAEIQERCRRKGLLFETDGPTLTFFPALTLDKATAGEAMKILARCV
jgi:acetylornithine/succinyldiaminopimelate/putrescine aminotransferase